VDPLLSGIVSVNDGDGTVTVTRPGGGDYRVRGSASVGSHVYIKGGQVMGIAPSLDQIDITV
jgi:hypothetical protein